MAWKFHSHSPSYLQIMEEVKRQIATGQLKPGDQVPSVRELAVLAGVNPNTMQKALSELEREGVLYSERTAGRFVAEKKGNLRQGMKEKKVLAFIKNMKNLGFSNDEIVDAVKTALTKEDV